MRTRSGRNVRMLSASLVRRLGYPAAALATGLKAGSFARLLRAAIWDGSARASSSSSVPTVWETTRCGGAAKSAAPKSRNSQDRTVGISVTVAQGHGQRGTGGWKGGDEIGVVFTEALAAEPVLLGPARLQQVLAADRQAK